MADVRCNRIAAHMCRYGRLLQSFLSHTETPYRTPIPTKKIPSPAKNWLTYCRFSIALLKGGTEATISQSWHQPSGDGQRAYLPLCAVLVGVSGRNSAD
jgi:hypothetical protein